MTISLRMFRPSNGGCDRRQLPPDRHRLVRPPPGSRHQQRILFQHFRKTRGHRVPGRLRGWNDRSLFGKCNDDLQILLCFLLLSNNYISIVLPISLRWVEKGTGSFFPKPYLSMGSLILWWGICSIAFLLTSIKKNMS